LLLSIAAVPSDRRRRLRPLARRDQKQLGAAGLEDEDPLIHAVAGSAASAVTTTLMNPIDVAKTRLQTQDYFSRGEILYRTTAGALMHMVKHEGFRSLGKGLLPSLMISVPSGALSIMIYECVKKLSVS
jgi:solute carrier family 25 phosphate transporter 23/24/25/41